MTMQYDQESGRPAAKSFVWVEEPHVAFASLDPLFAKELCYVSSYDSVDPLSPAKDKRGYQRPPTESRYKKIAAFFQKDNNRHRITPIVVSVRVGTGADRETFRKNLMAGDLEMLRGQKPLVSIIDGQHRLGGLAFAASKDSTFRPHVPVQLLFGMSFEEEASIFNTINLEQQKLPRSLVEVTKGDITEKGSVSYEQQIREITFRLCRDEDSVWGPLGDVEQINMTGMRDPQRRGQRKRKRAYLTFEGLRRSTTGMFPDAMLKRLKSIDEDLPVELAKTYWRGVSEACEGAWNNEPPTKQVIDAETKELRTVCIDYRIKELVAVGSLAQLGHNIISSYLETGDQGTRDMAKIGQLTSKLKAVDWTKDENNPWMRAASGWSGLKQLYGVLYGWVYADISPR